MCLLLSFSLPCSHHSPQRVFGTISYLVKYSSSILLFLFATLNLLFAVIVIVIIVAVVVLLPIVNVAVAAGCAH